MKLKQVTDLTALVLLSFMGLSAQTQQWLCGLDIGIGGPAAASDLICTRSSENGHSTLTVSGTGAMRDFPLCAVETCTPWGQVNKVVIEDGVTHIGDRAFAGNQEQLKEVIVSATNPPTLGNNAFYGTASVILRVPQSSINAYRAANVWKDFGYINPSTVTFNAQNASAPTTQLVSYGNTATRPATDPSRTGFSFVFWYMESDADAFMPYDFNTPVTYDITLLANWSSTTSVASRDRVIPQGKPKDESAAIAPGTTSASGLTAGPNPALRTSGGVAFYRQGALIVSASLSVYDAAGNVVRVLSIRDNAVGTHSNRRVGSWDLRDRKGRPVPEGTYLVNGTIEATGKKSEKVSVVVGVR